MSQDGITEEFSVGHVSSMVRFCGHHKNLCGHTSTNTKAGTVSTFKASRDKTIPMTANNVLARQFTIWQLADFEARTAVAT
jgi:hypothetical protein